MDSVIDNRQTYTRKEYFQLFDNMDEKIVQIRKEKELIEKTSNEKIEKLTESIRLLKSKNKILTKKVSEATDNFLKLSEKFDTI